MTNEPDWHETTRLILKAESMGLDLDLDGLTFDELREAVEKTS